MTTLQRQPYEIPAADLGPENPLPEFRALPEDGTFALHDNVPTDDKRYMGWRTAFRVLPYRMQDGYNRRRAPRAFEGLVLENDKLRATFLPELGGRLVSLFDKQAGRELLDRNPVFQPANLALRNAWFSGGIEWNTTLPGHYYLTCSRVGAARVGGADYPVLRLYEWDRVRCFPWQIDFHLPDKSPYLCAHVRILNPHDREIAMYWWTNMAVPEAPGSRVLFPASTAIGFVERQKLGVVDLPVIQGFDLSYAVNAPYAQEMFSRIGDGQRRWVACVDKTGTGFFEASTDRLRGRKMFCWGMNAGGRRWQEFLSEPGHAYIEIQAGLARTQLECIPMPAGATWDWTEAFGAIAADPAAVHGDNWQRACQTVDAAIESTLPRNDMEGVHEWAANIANRLPDEILSPVSGWGALERRRLQSAHANCGHLPEAAYPATGDPQVQWLALLESGKLTEKDPAADPGPEMVQPEWCDLLEKAVADPANDHWFAWYHLGVMRMEAGAVDAAREAFRHSVGKRPSCWAWRNLAVIAQRAGDDAEARACLARAWDCGPPVLHIALECARALAAAKDFDALDEFLKKVPDAFRAHERMRVVSAQAALARGDFAEVERLFDHDFATNREGEVVLTDLWFALQEHKIAAAENRPVDDDIRRRARKEFPPPRHIDFRMVAEVE